MSHTHFIEQCCHGIVVLQCRCFSSGKSVRVVPCPPSCTGSSAQANQAAHTIRSKESAMSDIPSERRFYLADGSVIELEPDEVVRRRIAMAEQHAKMAEFVRWIVGRPVSPFDSDGKLVELGLATYEHARAAQVKLVDWIKEGDDV